MRIDDIKINSYGKLKDKELSLKNGINIIYGENEKGKSTLLNYIINIFYGTSRNKKGRAMSDYEKYKPWDGEDFSGKIKYTLDNNESYEVYREFGKKNAKIYNNKMEDISKEFSIDKNTGNQFFYEQTNVDEQTFISTVVSFQKEVEIDNQTQNILIQKIANTSSTGDDNISYKKALDKLSKKQLDEIGTSRSQGKPINNVINEIESLQLKKKELERFEDYQFEIEEKQHNLEEKIKMLNLQYNAIKELNSLKQEEEVEQSKLKFNERKIDELENQIQDLIKQRDELNSNKKTVTDTQIDSSKVNIYIIIAIILIAISAVIIILKKPIVGVIMAVISVILIGIGITKKIKAKRKNDELENKQKGINLFNKELERKIYEIDAQINLLEQNEKSQINETEQIRNEILRNINMKKMQCISKFKIQLGETFINDLINCTDIQKRMEFVQNLINETNIEMHKLDLDKENILPKIEEYAVNEEKLAYNNEQLELLNKKNDSINLAKELIEIAYQKMKDNVTPKFTKNLSKSISEITNSKYNKVIINEENGIMVEISNGDYKELTKFSTGTIEQLYLSFRISMLEDISEENMPILFDEAFAYYDDVRLKNTIDSIYKKYSNNHQIVFFTCTNREEKICEDLGIQYNKVSL